MKSLALFFVLCFSVTLAWAGSPSVTSIVPQGPVPGKKTEITFNGSDLEEVGSLWTSFECQSKRIAATSTNVTFLCEVPNQPGLAIGAVRLAGSNGISPLQLVLLDPVPANPLATNIEPVRVAVVAKQPIALEGVCAEQGSSALIPLKAKKGDKLRGEVVAHQLGSPLDPFVRILDSRGQELFFAEDNPSMGRDCRFLYQFANAGDYTLEIRDAKYSGSARHTFRVRLGGEQASQNIPVLRKSTSGTPVPEKEPNDIKAQSISAPVTISGTFGRKRDRDVFEFNVIKNQSFSVSARTRSLGSPCDALLRFESGEGKTLAESPVGTIDEPTLTHTFKESGMARLIMEEVVHLAGPEYFYQLNISSNAPLFSISTDSDTYQAVPGKTVEMKLMAIRNGYEGPIKLRVEPAAFSVEEPVIKGGGKTNNTTIRIQVPSSFHPGEVVHLKVLAEAEAFSTSCSTKPALRKRFPEMLFPRDELSGLIAIGIVGE